MFLVTWAEVHSVTVWSTCFFWAKTNSTQEMIFMGSKELILTLLNFVLSDIIPVAWDLLRKDYLYYVIGKYDKSILSMSRDVTDWTIIGQGYE